MVELPEAVTLSRQITDSLAGKVIEEVNVLQSPHKWAWLHGDPADYPGKLRGKTVAAALPYGSMVEVNLGPTTLLLTEGVNLRHIEEESSLPKKHQLLLRFSDGTYFCVSIQMYGGLFCFEGDEYQNSYYLEAKQRPSPLSRGFSAAHFLRLLDAENLLKLSAKAFLATEQRIPGLGNGVLQDILFNARIHPKRKMDGLSAEEMQRLRDSIKSTLGAMVDGGGRDTERDLFGNFGGYRTILSKNTVGCPCPECGSIIEKSSYMGGSVYVCPGCQKL